MKTITINTNDALELYDAHSRSMYQQSADLGYNHEKARSASDIFSALCERLGFEYLEGQRIANTVWINYKDIIAKRGREKITIAYDMSSDYLMRGVS